MYEAETQRQATTAMNQLVSNEVKPQKTINALNTCRKENVKNKHAATKPKAVTET